MSAFVDVTAIIDGQPFLVRSDRGYAAAILQKDEFEPGLVQTIKALANGSKVAMDVGANIGCTSILLSSLAERVLSFEPAPSTFNLLLHNTTGIENICLYNFALGDSAKKATIQFSKDNRSGGFISETRATEGHATENIIIKTLDQLIEEEAIQALDFIKIDTEGFELSVLAGAKNALAKFSPIVIGEINHWCLNAFQRTSIPDFFDTLRATFPTIIAIDHERRRIANLKDSDQSYVVMHEHIVKGMWSEFVGAFEDERLAKLRDKYRVK
jgi:FkbM family methyltransferase